METVVDSAKWHCRHFTLLLHCQKGSCRCPFFFYCLSFTSVTFCQAHAVERQSHLHPQTEYRSMKPSRVILLQSKKKKINKLQMWNFRIFRWKVKLRVELRSCEFSKSTEQGRLSTDGGSDAALMLHWWSLTGVDITRTGSNGRKTTVPESFRSQKIKIKCELFEQCSLDLDVSFCAQAV